MRCFCLPDILIGAIASPIFIVAFLFCMGALMNKFPKKKLK